MAAGAVDGTYIYPKEVIKAAIAANAASLILVHNNPSGTLHATEQDIRLTRQLTEFCSKVGISFYDHLIVTRSGAYSIKMGSLIRTQEDG